MILQVLSVYDSASEVYGRPVFAPAVGSVVREVTDAINGAEDTTLSRHPRDFRLFHLGAFNDVSGLFDLFPLPRLVCDCGSLKMAVGHAGSEATGSAAGRSPDS